MKYTLESLMAQVGCAAYPERWHDIFADAMAAYDRDGCALADPAYYDALHEKYGCMERHGDLYRSAAVQVAADEPLARFLTLLIVALRDDEHRGEDIRRLSLLKAPQGKAPLAYNMITGLALCSQLDRANENLLARGLPDKNRLWSLRTAVDCGVDTYMRQHHGEPGYNLLSWAQLHLQGRLARLGRLEIEFFASFRGKATVFENLRGERVALANDIKLHKSGFALGSLYCEDETDSWQAVIEEEEHTWCGYPYREDGYVDRGQVTLNKAEWRQVLTTGDPIIALHIPSHAHYGPLTPESVDASLAAAVDFAAKYFPDFKYKAFGCQSWLMDPQLTALVGEESNIGKFLGRFEKLTAKSQGKAVFNFIFNRADTDFDWHELPERTRLEKGLKEHYLSGKAIYEMIGYFFERRI